MIIGAILRNNVEAKAFVNKTHKRLKNNPMLNGGAFYTEDESTRLKCYFGLKPVPPSLFFLARMPLEDGRTLCYTCNGNKNQEGTKTSLRSRAKGSHNSLRASFIRNIKQWLHKLTYLGFSVKYTKKGKQGGNL